MEGVIVTFRGTIIPQWELSKQGYEPEVIGMILHLRYPLVMSK
jgi:hypothetical protein